MDLAKCVWQTLASAGPSVRALNNPSIVLNRRQMLSRLHKTGDNPFAAYGIEEDRSKIRFPVFIRRADEHDGNLSPLVQSFEELDSAISELRRGGLSDDQML